MFSCDRCEKKYGHIHKLHHHKRWGCKGHPPETCMLSSPRRAGSSNCYTLPPAPEKGEAGLVAYVRRSLSVTCVREQARMLHDQLQLLGDGAAEAGRRRARAEQLEAAAERERHAQTVAFLQGRSMRMFGFGRLDI